MNNTIKTILTALFILSLAIELTYTLGVWTRQYVLPAVIYCAVAMYHYGMQGWDALTTQEWSVKVYNTPLTTGLA